MNLRRSVFRLLLVTCFLLFIAWVSLKVMKYNGNWEQMFYDLSHTGIGQFAQEKFKDIIDAVMKLFQENIQPQMQGMMEKAMTVGN